MTVWLNGAYVDAAGAVDARDRGLLLGDGAFETVYVDDARAAFLGAHLTRLSRGLEQLRIARPERLGDAAAIVAELYQRNRLQGPAAARITVTRGAGGRGLMPDTDGAPTLLISLAPAPPPTAAPAVLHLSAQRRFAGAAAAGFKAIGGYLDNIIAEREAKDAGADTALMLNEHGRLSSAAVANVFLIAESRIATPPLADGAMPGIVRGLIMEAAAARGEPVDERPIAAAELERAQIFITNSLIGLRPAVMKDAPPLDRGPPGNIFADLQTWYQGRLARELAAESAAS